MRTIILGLVCFGLAAASAQGQLTTNKMIKVVTRDTSPDTPDDSFGAKPKTLYRMGETYGRSEECPDTEQGIHGLMVIAEPKIWIINLLDKTGRLIIDPGPTYVFRAPIIPPEGANQIPPLPDFEFGREYDFLRLHKAAHSQETVNGRQYDVLSLSLEGYNITLLSTPGKDIPFRVIIRKKGKVVCQYDYDEYKTGLMPQMDLFGPPQNIKIVEATESSAGKDNEKALEQLGTYLMNFYQAPTLEGFTHFQEDVDRLEKAFEESGNGADVLLAVSLARVSEKHNWPISGKGNTAKRAKDILEGKSEFARYVKNDDAVDPGKLDIWWTSFFATGNTIYLHKLLRFAGEPMPENDVNRLLVIGAATWSFKSNCRQHKIIMEFAESQIKEVTNPEKKAFLIECTEQVNDTGKGAKSSGANQAP